MSIIEVIAQELGLKIEQVKSTVALIDEGATIPFIARYRKEVTGSLDDSQIRDLDARLQYLRNLETRKTEVSSSIEDQGKLTEEISLAIAGAKTLVEVEDIYRPYKPKRRTRASIARDRGLEPLAEILESQDINMRPPLLIAEDFVDPEKDLPDVQSALAGAMDIIAENISDNADIRKKLRDFFMKNASVKTVGTTENDSVYKTYYDYTDSVLKVPGHRILAINRGEKEDFLKVSIEIDDNRAVDIIKNMVIKGPSPALEYLSDALSDSYSRLIFPSISNEVRGAMTERAQAGAVKLFGENLSQLLMQPPLKGKVVMGLDPGIRTGCKVAVVDETGKALDTGVIFPVPPFKKIKEAKAVLAKMVKDHSVEIIAIGNGTASRETELFAAEFISEIDQPVSYMVVSEAGASVYSASKLAADEFPEYDVTLRSAISIARRIQDPLAELVKIDPKAIGVGQYQHDMPPKELDESLGGVVENCVNTVGVDLNTASHSLLSYVAGVNSTTAKNIVSYREEHGAFGSRTQLLKVPRLGKKAFEQCAGFLRVPEGKSILDNTAVHPESYKAAEIILKDCGYTLSDVENNRINDLKAKIKEVGAGELAQKAGVGIPTLGDIVEELLKPGRDLRDSLPPPILRTDVMSMSDLKPDMIITGTVRNVIDFGAFVDIGVHQDGLVHVSQLSNNFVKHPLDVVKIGDIVQVKVIEVDEKKGRISLTMKGVPQGS